MRLDGWVRRDAWISGDKSLVYWSRKEEGPLTYFTASDLALATLEVPPAGQAALPWAFVVKLPSHRAEHLAPGVFAAGSQEQRNLWMKELGMAIAFLKGTALPTLLSS